MCKEQKDYDSSHRVAYGFLSGIFFKFLKKMKTICSYDLRQSIYKQY